MNNEAGSMLKLETGLGISNSRHVRTSTIPVPSARGEHGIPSPLHVEQLLAGGCRSGGQFRRFPPHAEVGWRR